MDTKTRRDFLKNMGACGIALSLGGCGREREENEVTAVEDLMREHGILRRALLVYKGAGGELRKKASPFLLGTLQKTAKLFRSFGEDYHEKALEEKYIFPIFSKSGNSSTALVKTLVAQHNRGREITDYILKVTQKTEMTSERADEFAKLLDSFVVMYEHHTAREDTDIFPAWKHLLSDERLDELGEKFEKIEHDQFGEDGFEHALQQISDIESALGFADLSRYTTPPAPGF
jgi:hemerythrin-like domain-containing protein